MPIDSSISGELIAFLAATAIRWFSADNVEFDGGVVALAVWDDGPGFSDSALRPGHGLESLQTLNLMRTQVTDVGLKELASLGLTGVHDAGIDAATGDCMAFLDSDDWWHPRKLAVQLAWMRASGMPISMCVAWFSPSDSLSRMTAHEASFETTDSMPNFLK